LNHISLWFPFISSGNLCITSFTLLDIIHFLGFLSKNKAFRKLGLFPALGVPETNQSDSPPISSFISTQV